MMPRKNFPFWNLICENRWLLSAQIHEWTDGEELERVMIKLIDSIRIQESDNPNAAQLLSDDCKFERIPMVSHEALIPPLRFLQ
ncbi:Inorganic diphosphatase [Handroanthus impetiginosus]|uniref:Inorganic diphosphatase n=1 Tax=Handroanthus impetiginosus TaxID=429701 RepID=A0A2G9GGT7_9LAMI|nr:Inorganic diphosphatase [Handroanthus impetiginosus]PIN04501.1 Inorganic diphosphatase [Handroanthus impetiginosus]